jgi:dipeptidase E
MIDPRSRHMGETREQRLAEFHEENDVTVLGPREGSWLRVRDGHAHLGGTASARLFRRNHDTEEIPPGSDLTHLLDHTPHFDQP